MKDIEPHRPLDTDKEGQKTDEELTIEFIQKYRSKMGLPELKDYKAASLKGALGHSLNIYRYLAPGRQFAITGDEKVKDALVEAGATRVIPYTKTAQDTKTYYDVALPPFLWTYL